MLLVSCAGPGAYYQGMSRLVATGQYSQAADLIKESKESVYGSKNALLYCLDRGMLLQLAGHYRASNDAFEKAKSLAEDYFTKSITTEASTFLVSDNMRPYYGEDFERALVNIFCALNYVFLDQESEALVEARQVDEFLSSLQTKYGHKSVYKEDPFARYLMGMLYENEGEINDAYISYYKALQSYDEDARYYGVPVPKELLEDVWRTGQKLGFRDDLREIERKWGRLAPAARNPDDGEIVVIHYDGSAPVKEDTFFEIAFGKAWAYVGVIQPQGEEQAQVEQAAAIARGILFDEQIRVAFPRYVASEYNIIGMSAQASAADSGRVVAKNSSEEVENIGAIAVKCLEDRIARVRVRAIARAAIKYALAQKISQSVEESSHNEALGWLTKKVLHAASAATELSDKRSWRSLPDRIDMVRLTVPAGTYNLRLDFSGGSGATIDTKTLNNITVHPGKKTFAVVKTVS